MKSELAIFFEETSLALGGEELNFNVEVESSFALQNDVLEVPTSVFKENSGLRGIVRYLHDEQNMSFNEIASSLKRHINTVRTSYEKSKLITTISGEMLPVRIFEQNPPLEAASLYFAEKGYRLKDIATELGRSSKTIWTSLNRIGWKQ